MEWSKATLLAQAMGKIDEVTRAVTPPIEGPIQVPSLVPPAHTTTTLSLNPRTPRRYRRQPLDSDAVLACGGSGDLEPLDAFAAGIGDHRIVTTLCPGGKERMRRLMNAIASRRADLRSLVTHRFKLDQIEEAYDLFANQRDGVLKVAITP